jgi:hypothetical protein
MDGSHYLLWGAPGTVVRIGADKKGEDDCMYITC